MSKFKHLFEQAPVAPEQVQDWKLKNEVLEREIKDIKDSNDQLKQKILRHYFGTRHDGMTFYTSNCKTRRQANQVKLFLINIQTET